MCLLERPWLCCCASLQFAGHMSNLHGVIAAVDEAVLRFHSGDGEAVPQPILEAVRKRCQAHSVSGPVTGEGSGPAASAPEPRFGTASLRPIPLPWQAARSAELREVIASEASEAVQWIVQHALKEVRQGGGCLARPVWPCLPGTRS